MEPTVLTPEALGARVARARDDASMSQAELAAQLDLDRSSVSRIESGGRKVSAAELVQISAILGRPIGWFVTDEPEAVRSRRRGLGSHASTRHADLAIESVAMDVRYLLDRGVLGWSKVEPRGVPGSHEEAERLAGVVRTELQMGPEPLLDLGAKAERLGVYAFSLDLGDADDGASVELVGDRGGRVGVAVVNGAQDPGRRRWTLAHEIAHVLTGDAYAGEANSAAVERYLDSFVAYLLMPRSGTVQLWSEFSGEAPGRAALALAARYRTSWTAACNHLRNVDLIDGAQLEALKRYTPTAGDFMRYGETWSDELTAPYVPPGYAASALSAHVDGALTQARTIELLRGSLAPEDLPEVDAHTVDSLARAFDSFA